MKKHTIIFFIIHFIVLSCCGQEVSPAAEQQLENLTDADQAETEDDSYLQQLEQYKKNPVNLNTAEASELKELRIVTDLQIANLISYRRLLGPLIHLYELQAIPAWDINTIRKLLPFVAIVSPLSVKDDFLGRFRGGDHGILFRFSLFLEQAKGFDKSTTGTIYAGSPQRLFFRYRYAYKNLLQYGLTGDKDAGEQFFRGAQKKGFDFYSFHLFARNMGIIKALALGDFTVNMGQGLIQWQSQAFKKSAEITGVKRQSSTLRPYNSAGEVNFNRGIGTTFRKGRTETTVFISMRRLSANFVRDSMTSEDHISSIQMSGNHRTEAEIADRNKFHQVSFGGRVEYTGNRWQININGISYRFSNAIRKRDEPYNIFAISGKNWYNLSLDYSYTYKNVHFFGEAAADKNFNKAFLNGLLISVDSKVDVSLVHRFIAQDYQAMNGNAFTENTFPNNEIGFYAGITVRPAVAWRLDAYADMYKFPWLRSLADAPGYGRDFLVQLTYTPNRQVEIYTRYRNENKQSNEADNTGVTNYLVDLPKQNWRTHISYKINAAITLRNRVEIVLYNKKGHAEKGFLSFFDVLYKPLMKSFSGILRLQYFEADSYNARLYAYENDVLYSYSIPVFSDNGYRYYITLNYDVSKRISIWIRVAQSIYRDKAAIGSGLEEIKGNRKTEIKMQVRYLF